MQTTMNTGPITLTDTTPSVPRPGSGMNGSPMPIQTLSSPAVPTRSTLTISKAKGMQLGANKVPPNVASAILAAQLAAEAEEEEAIENEGADNPWGNDDLIDIDADQDDWSKS
jgi:SCY1-like protein 1